MQKTPLQYVHLEENIAVRGKIFNVMATQERVGDMHSGGHYRYVIRKIGCDNKPSHILYTGSSCGGPPEFSITTKFLKELVRDYYKARYIYLKKRYSIE